MAYLQVAAVDLQRCCALLTRQLPVLLLEIACCCVAKVHCSLLDILWCLVYGLQAAAKALFNLFTLWNNSDMLALGTP
jgi:hypothetical protein